MTEELIAYLNDTKIGTITRDSSRTSNRVQLIVDAEFTGGLADLTEGFTLSPGKKIGAGTASNFLGGYVPEGPSRQLLAEKKGIKANDLYGLLRHYGLTLAGALSVRTGSPDDDAPGTYRDLSDREMLKKVKDVAKTYDLGNEPDSGRSALPGFQAKLLVRRDGNQWRHPERRAHSTHIVKPASARRPTLIFDEFYSHELTRHMGLAKFDSELTMISGTTFLTIERYDRKVKPNGGVALIHQEDAAQALGLDWEDFHAKFQNPEYPQSATRPSASAIASVFANMDSEEDINTWLKYLIYGVLVGNHDGHAKNVSIIHESGSSRIAELYDAVPILHINDISTMKGEDKINDNLALAVNGVFQHHRITSEDFAAEAGSWEVIPDRRIHTIIDGVFESFGAALDAVEPPAGASKNLTTRLRYNLDQLSAGKSIGKPKQTTLTAVARS